MGLLLNIGNIIGGALSAPFTIIVGTVMGVIILLAVSFAWISGATLYVVTSPWFFSWGYTNNPVVKIGLDITKEFVNLTLVVVLVFIALAISLRLKEYATQKTLARLIIIALLVNFAPVVVGLIVDASNIVMGFFLIQVKEGITSILSGISIEEINAVVNDIIKLFIGTLTTKGSILAKGAVYAVLCFVLGLAFLLYAFIFLFRYITIWILTILSPLAFVAWILPATKKFWDMWWEQLIQWSIIGIPMAFFLYLAMATYGGLNAYFGKNLPLLPSLDEITTGVLNKIFPYYMVLALLYLGFFIGLQTSAIGASSVINFAKSKGKATAKWTGKFAGRQARAATGRVLGAEGKRWLAKQATAKPLPTPEELKGKGWAGRQLTRAGSLASWAVRRGVGEAGLRLVEAERKDIRKAEDEYKGTTAERKLAAMRFPKIPTNEKIGALRQAIEEGQTKDLQDLGMTDKEIINIGNQALKTSPEEFKKIRDVFSHLSEDMGKGFSEIDRKRGGVMDFDDSLNNLNKRKASLDAKITKTKPGRTKTALEEELKKMVKEIEDVEREKKQYGTIETKIIAKIKPELIPKMAEGALKTEGALAAVSQFWSGHQFKTAVESPGGKEFLEDFNKYTTEVLKKKGKDFYKKINYALYKYSVSSPGSSLGIRKLG